MAEEGEEHEELVGGDDEAEVKEVEKPKKADDPVETKDAKDAKQHKDLGREWACGFGNHKVSVAFTCSSRPSNEWGREVAFAHIAGPPVMGSTSRTES